MPFNKKSFTNADAGFGDATMGELMDAEDSRDPIAEEKAINPQYAAMPDPTKPSSWTTTGS
jgi:hypothetical protein